MSEREVFEYYAKAAGLDLYRENGSDYMSLQTRSAWDGWKARSDINDIHHAGVLINAWEAITRERQR